MVVDIVNIIVFAIVNIIAIVIVIVNIIAIVIVVAIIIITIAIVNVIVPIVSPAQQFRPALDRGLFDLQKEWPP